MAGRTKARNTVAASLSRRRRRHRAKAKLLRPIGRPCKYSPAVARKICKAVEKGCSRVAAAALAGVAASTLHEWRNAFPEFSEGLEKADARFEAGCVASIRKAGRSRRHWTALAWLLERKLPQRYGKVDRHILGSDGGGPLVLTNEYVLAISRSLGYTGKLVPIDNRGARLVGDTPRNATGELAALSEGDDVIDVDILPQD